jgi:hypothetical protein
LAILRLAAGFRSLVQQTGRQGKRQSGGTPGEFALLD